MRDEWKTLLPGLLGMPEPVLRAKRIQARGEIASPPLPGTDQDGAIFAVALHHVLPTGLDHLIKELRQSAA